MALASLSVIHPLTPAIERSRRVLFEPFQLSKWLRLGFCAFLAGATPAGFGGGGSGFPSGRESGGGGSDAGSDPLSEVLAGASPWIQAHLATLIGLAAIAVVVVLLVGLVLIWLSSRGMFMLLDGVVRNRAAIAAPWREYRREGNSLFRFRVIFGLVGLLGMGLIVAGPLWAFQLGWPPSLAVTLAVISALLLVVWLLALLLGSLLLLDFVVPMMLLHRIPVLAAWRLVLRGVVLPHPGSVAVYVLARILVNASVGIVSVLAILLSCCLALVPYLGAVILLPLTLFQLCYPLAFLGQLGPDWQLLPADQS